MANTGFPIAAGQDVVPGSACILNGSNELILSTAAADAVVGIVLQVDQGQTRASLVVGDEVLAKVTASGADLSIGDELMSDGAGGLTNFGVGTAVAQFVKVESGQAVLADGSTARCKVIHYTTGEQHT